MPTAVCTHQEWQAIRSLFIFSEKHTLLGQPTGHLKYVLQEAALVSNGRLLLAHFVNVDEGMA
jgi:hypothetical protein